VAFHKIDSYMSRFAVIASTNITIATSQFKQGLSSDVTVRVGGVSGGEFVELYYGQIISPQNDKVRSSN